MQVETAPCGLLRRWLIGSTIDADTPGDLEPLVRRVLASRGLSDPDETDAFTPEPDRAANIWFARDLGPMAEALGTEPLLIVAESHGGLAGGGEWPKPLRLGVSLVNNHLQYAITWFSLALIWAVMSAMLVRRERPRLDRD